MVKGPRPNSISEPERRSIAVRKTDCFIENRDFGSKFLERRRNVETVEDCYENCKNLTG